MDGGRINALSWGYRGEALINSGIAPLSPLSASAQASWSRRLLNVSACSSAEDTGSWMSSQALTDLIGSAAEKVNDYLIETL